MKNKEKNFVSAVVYVHNVEDRISGFLKSIVNVLETNFEHSEIICVNDCSTDLSVDKIKELSNIIQHTSLSVINMSYYHGIEVAMNAGVDLAIGDFVFEFDSITIDYELDEIMNIYRKSLEGFDIVSAVPNRKEKFTSRLFYKTYNRFCKTPLEMHTETFRVLSRRVINRIGDMNKSIPYRKAIYLGQGLKTCSIIYELNENTHDLISCNTNEKGYRMELAIDSLILFTSFGYRFSMGMAIFMMVMTIGVLIYTMLAYIVSQPVEGWTSTILFLSIAFFGLFGILTIIIKYLEILINLIFRRKHYSFESIQKLTK